MIKRPAPLFCALLLATSANTAEAQRTTDLILGAGGTMGFATDEEATESRMGLNASGGLSLRMTDLVGLRVEAGFIEKGAGSEVSEDGASGQANVEVDYFELRGMFEIGGRLHLLAGASAGRDLRCNVAIDVSVEGRDLSTDRTCDELMIERNIDYGIVGGVGYSLGPLGVTALFTEGMSEIFADDSGPEGRNRTISIIGSLRIPIG